MVNDRSESIAAQQGQGSELSAMCSKPVKESGIFDYQVACLLSREQRTLVSYFLCVDEGRITARRSHSLFAHDA